MRAAAAGVFETRATVIPIRCASARPEGSGLALSLPTLEEAERLRTIADENVLRLLIVVEHHLVRLAPDARLLVAAERGVCGIEVVAVGPNAARLDPAPHA